MKRDDEERREEKRRGELLWKGKGGEKGEGRKEGRKEGMGTSTTQGLKSQFIRTQ